MELSNKTEPEYIRAKRGGREQSFTRETWNMLPGKNHQGWEEIIEEPEEVKPKGPTAEEIAWTALAQIYKTVFGVDTVPALTLAEMQNQIEEKQAEIQANAEKALQADKDKEESDQKLKGLIERFKKVTGEDPKFEGTPDADEIARFEKYILDIEATKEEDEKKAEADRLKTIADAKKTAESKTPAVKKVGAPKAPKADEGTGSKAPTPEDLLNKISKEA